MALWKPFLGNRASLNNVEKHAGYVYWCADDGSLHFDYADANGELHRKQISADTLTGYLGSAQITHGDDLLSNIIEAYILSIDYSALAFDTTEIVVNATNTTSVLGQAILGQMVLA